MTNKVLEIIIILLSISPICIALIWAFISVGREEKQNKKNRDFAYNQMIKKIELEFNGLLEKIKYLLNENNYLPEELYLVISEDFITRFKDDFVELNNDKYNFSYILKGIKVTTVYYHTGNMKFYYYTQTYGNKEKEYYFSVDLFNLLVPLDILYEEKETIVHNSYLEVMNDKKEIIDKKTIKFIDKSFETNLKDKDNNKIFINDILLFKEEKYKVVKSVYNNLIYGINLENEISIRLDKINQEASLINFMIM